MSLTVFQKICLWGFIIFQNLFCIFLVILVVLNAEDDNIDDQFCLRDSAPSNGFQNPITKKNLMVLSILLFLGSFGMSLYIYLSKINQYQIGLLIKGSLGFILKSLAIFFKVKC
jgi:hypothetical protein